MTDEYRQALERAQRELADCDIEAEDLERKRAKLRQTVAVLQTLLGGDAQAEESLTLGILGVVKGADGFITAADVEKRLKMMGYSGSSATVATILSRLARSGQLLSGVNVGGSGSGYMWPAGSLYQAMEKADISKQEVIDRFKKVTSAMKRVNED